MKDKNLKDLKKILSEDLSSFTKLNIIVNLISPLLLLKKLKLDEMKDN